MSTPAARQEQAEAFKGYLAKLFLSLIIVAFMALLSLIDTDKQNSNNPNPLPHDNPHHDVTTQSMAESAGQASMGIDLTMLMEIGLAVMALGALFVAGNYLVKATKNRLSFDKKADDDKNAPQSTPITPEA